MKNDLSTYIINKPDVYLPELKKILHPYVIIESGEKELDKFFGGFKAGQIVFIDGSSKIISSISNQVCVNTYRAYLRDIVYIDGGMCVNPYRIAQYARKVEIDHVEVLKHVHICRAFTIFQMTTILHDMLEQIIKKHNLKTLIIGKFPDLYFDSDISFNESEILLKNNLKKVRELTTKYDLVTILSNLNETTLSKFRDISKKLYNNVDEIIRINQIENSINIYLVKREENTTIPLIEKGQLCLVDFEMVT